MADDGEGWLGSLVRGLTRALERLDEMTEPDGDGRQGAVGFQVRAATDGSPPSTRPIRPVEREVDEGEVAEIRAVELDVFPEADHVLVVAELPGVAREQLSWTVHGDLLQLEATADDRTYRAEALLPGSVQADGVHLGLRNGILELRLPWAGKEAP